MMQTDTKHTTVSGFFNGVDMSCNLSSSLCIEAKFQEITLKASVRDRGATLARNPLL